MDPIKIKGRVVRLQKAVVSPAFGAQTVLTNSPWAFVGLWLKRNQHKTAAFYWDQAQAFHNASIGLPTQSAPLLLYYCFMNAAKALLSSKKVVFDPYHGLTRFRPGTAPRKISLSNETIQIKPRGILPSLSDYFGETESAKTHTVQELFASMPFIHRTYCLTYTSQRQVYVPLTECFFAFEKATREIYLWAKLDREATHPNLSKVLPNSIIVDPAAGLPSIRSATKIQWNHRRKPSSSDLEALRVLHAALRADLRYINGTQTLWYLRTKRTGARQLKRQTPTLTLAAMHWLSEICRYRPVELAAFMDGQKNWLLSEFITMSPTQFLDEIAAEITGYQFMIPNVRSPE